MMQQIAPRWRPRSARGLSAAGALVAGLALACTTETVKVETCAPDGAADAAATDAVADAASADAGPQDAGGLTDGDEPDGAGGGGDGGAPDDSGAIEPGPALPACDAAAALPSWASADATQRSAVFTCGAISLHAEVWSDGVLRLRYVGLQPDPRPNRSYAVATERDPAAGFAVSGGDDDRALLCSGALVLEVSRDPTDACQVVVRDAAGEVLIDERGAGLGYAEGTGDVGGPKPWTVGVARRVAGGEHFYGFGEKNGPLDKRGMSLRMWNSDKPGYSETQDPLYQSIPFFIGLRGQTAYGLLNDNSFETVFEMGSVDPTRYDIRAAGGEVDQFVVAGPGIDKVLERYTWLTGRMTLPPKWTLGYHQSRHGYHPDSVVKDLATEFRNRDIPCDALWLDIDYMDGFRSWTWSPTDFPDPKGLTTLLSSQGFHTVAIIDPGLKVDPGWSVYDDGLAGGYYITQPDGQPYIGQVWPGDSVYPDYTNPDARAWWADLTPALTDVGVEGIWIDMNEPANFMSEHQWTVPNEMVGDGEGTTMTMAEIHNVYGSAMAWATYDGMVEHHTGKRPWVLTRAAYAGVQRWAASWTGDVPSTWPALASSLPMLMGMGLSGEPNVGTDAGGWVQGGDSELYARWMVLGAFSPFYRQHSEKNGGGKEPWNQGPEAEEIVRQANTWRYSVMPYLYTVFEESTRTGAPVLRPLVYTFQADGVAHTLDKQGMLGDALMVAPVVSQGASTHQVYFPAGRWTEVFSGRVFEGPTFASFGVKLGAIPVFAREGSVVPMQQPMQHVDALPVDPLTLALYPAPLGSPRAQNTFVVNEDDGMTREHAQGAFARTPYTLRTTVDGAELVIGARTGSWQPPTRRVVLKVQRVDSAPTGVELGGEPLAPLADLAALQSAKAGESGWLWDASDRALLVLIPDTTEATVTMHYDATLQGDAPAVTRRFELTVPSGDHGAQVPHIALSSKGWSHTPLAWHPTKPGVAFVDVDVPRGAWFDYKYTLGGWDSVEVAGDCASVGNRYAFGRAHPVKVDAVSQWTTWCP
jgi:alpha-glucosidase